MDKVALYLLFLLIYVGLAKSLSINERGIISISDKQEIAKLIQDSPMSIILINMHTTGFLVKSYYHKYSIVYGYKPAEKIIMKVSPAYYKTNKDFIGLSLLRRFSTGEVEFLPLPPGSLFLGNQAYGTWNRQSSKEKTWRFHRAYRHLYRYLGWGNFRPSYKFFQELSSARKANSPFWGLNGEFGPNGELTQKIFPHYFQKKIQPSFLSFKSFLKQFSKSFFTLELKNE